MQLQNQQTQQQQQAWQLQAAHLKEQQRQLQQQQRLLGALPTLPQPQHQQLLAPHQPYMPNLSSQHMGLQSQHIISQQSQNLQKQLGQQQQVATASEVAQCSLPSSSLQSAPVSPAGSGSSSLNSQQQQCLPQQNQAPGQMPQIPGPAKLGQAKQFQKHQQQQTSRVSKGVSRGPMMMQGLSQSNNLPANVNIGGKEMPGELPGQTGGHPLQQGQRVLQPQGQIQSGKLQAWSQQGIAGQKPQLQSQGAQLQGGAQSQGLAYIAGQQKGHQQQQGAQVLASKQQQSQQQAASSQQQTQRTSSPQQAQAQQQLPLSAQISQPQLQPPTPCQQQQQQQQSQQNQRWPMQQQQEPPHQRRSVSLKLPK
jgi:glucose repression mediator protein